MESQLTIETAKELLAKFSCLEPRLIQSALEKQQLQEALKLFKQISDYQNFGICADCAAAGFSALTIYLQSLGYEIPFETVDISNSDHPVYIKFSTRRTDYYLDGYTGKYRGVLVSVQSAEHEDINGTYGYLPLDLFDIT